MTALPHRSPSPPRTSIGGRCTWPRRTPPTSRASSTHGPGSVAGGRRHRRRPPRGRRGHRPCRRSPPRWDDCAATVRGTGRDRAAPRVRIRRRSGTSWRPALHAMGEQVARRSDERGELEAGGNQLVAGEGAVVAHAGVDVGQVVAPSRSERTAHQHRTPPVVALDRCRQCVDDGGVRRERVAEDHRPGRARRGRVHLDVGHALRLARRGADEIDAVRPLGAGRRPGRGGCRRLVRRRAALPTGGTSPASGRPATSKRRSRLAAIGTSVQQRARRRRAEPTTTAGAHGRSSASSHGWQASTSAVVGFLCSRRLPRTSCLKCLTALVT